LLRRVRVSPRSRSPPTPPAARARRGTRRARPGTPLPRGPTRAACLPAREARIAAFLERGHAFDEIVRRGCERLVRGLEPAGAGEIGLEAGVQQSLRQTK